MKDQKSVYSLFSRLNCEWIGAGDLNNKSYKLKTTNYGDK